MSARRVRRLNTSTSCWEMYVCFLRCKDTYKDTYKDTCKDTYKDTYKDTHKDTHKDTYVFESVS